MTAAVSGGRKYSTQLISLSSLMRRQWILQEATSLLEEYTRDKFPDLPLSKDSVLSSNKITSFLDSIG
jgi:hypothetical protein